MKKIVSYFIFMLMFVCIFVSFNTNTLRAQTDTLLSHIYYSSLQIYIDNYQSKLPIVASEGVTIVELKYDSITNVISMRAQMSDEIALKLKEENMSAFKDNFLTGMYSVDGSNRIFSLFREMQVSIQVTIADANNQNIKMFTVSPSEFYSVETDERAMSMYSLMKIKMETLQSQVPIGLGDSLYVTNCRMVNHCAEITFKYIGDDSEIAFSESDRQFLTNSFLHGFLQSYASSKELIAHRFKEENISIKLLILNKTDKQIFNINITGEDIKNFKE